METRWVIVLSALALHLGTTAASPIATSVFKSAAPSVVMVKATTAQGDRQGSAVAFDRKCISHRENNRNLPCQMALTKFSTNAHVVGEAENVQLLWDKSVIDAAVVYRDSHVDLAILEVFGVPIPVAEPNGNRTRPPEIGEAVFAIGAPLGLQRTMSEGIVSGLRMINMTPTVQTTAAISPGSSGGGLFDANGNFIAVTTYKYDRGEALNFAIDAGLVRDIEIALTTREVMTAFMRRQGFEFPNKYGGDRFIKWFSGLVTGPNGRGLRNRTMDYWDAQGEFDKTRDVSVFVRAIQDMLAKFEGASRSSSGGNMASVTQPLRLTCRYAQVRYDPTEQVMNLIVDIAGKSVDGFPAEVSDSRIRWRRQGASEVFTLVIDRFTGDFEVSTPQIAPLMKGRCAKTGDKLF
jgi:hypothetical protein